MVDKVEALLQRGGMDFAQLKERIKVQSTNDPPPSDDPTPKAGISWDVRKSSSSATAHSSIVRNSIERMERDAKEEREREKSLPAENAWSKKLNFEPPPKLRNSSSSCLTPSPFGPNIKTQRKKAVSLEVTGKSLKIDKVYVDSENNPLHPSSFNPPTPSTDNDLTDTEAIENVWAEAEAWVEKEERKEQEEGREAMLEGEGGEERNLEGQGQDEYILCPRQLASLAAARRLMLFYTTN